MIFRKVSESKYIGYNNITLHTCLDGSYSICIGNKVTSWGNGFRTIRSAEIFLNNHNYIKATTESIPVSQSDIDYISDFYGFDHIDENIYIKDDVKIVFSDKGDLLFILADGSTLSLELEDALEWLDNRFNYSEILSSVIFRGINFRQILAAKNNKTTRDITRNLVRVKSSNVWAYGVEVSNQNPKIGDVYVQFKGRNGGPEHIYVYYEVPLSLWRKFISSPSKGHFVYKYLRNNFMYSKLTGDKRGKLANAIN